MNHLTLLLGEVDHDMFEHVLESGESNGYVLSSDGGDVSAGLAIYDWIKSHRATIVATGLCGSIAPLVLQAGVQRIATPSSQFLLHDVSATIEGKPAPEYEKERVHMDNVVKRIMIERMGERNYHTALKIGIFGAETAVKLNLVDKIARIEG